MSLTVKLRSFNRKQHQAPQTALTQLENISLSTFNAQTSNARNSQAWRDRLKQDPVKLAQFKTVEAARAVQYRKNRSAASKLHEKENNRDRQRKYRGNRKLSELDEQDSNSSKNKKNKILTRNEKLKKREYDRQKKREERERMSAQKRRRIREKDALRKKGKRDKAKQRRNCANTTPNEILSKATGFRTSSAKRMARSRMWAKLPADAEKFADIVMDFVSGLRSTPRKQAALTARGFSTCRRAIHFRDPSDQQLRSTIQNLKKKKDSASLQKRRIIVRSLMVAKKYRMQKMLARKLDLRPGYITKLSKLSHEIEPTRKRRDDATCLDVVNNITVFFKDPKISRELPCMRTVIKQQQRYVMEVSIQKAYDLWKVDNPSYNIVSLSVFSRLRPSYVLLQHKTKLNQCLCEYCTCILLKLHSLTRILQANDCKQLKIKDKYELVSLSMCPKGDRKYHNLKCIERTCPDCGVSLLKERFKTLLGTCGDNTVSWQKWEFQAYNHDGKQKTKKVQLTKRGTCKMMLDELFTETDSLAKHLFTANWQHDQLKVIQDKLPDQWSLLILDFAENYSCISQDEIQSAHWATQQVTVHPIVAYYKCSQMGHNHIVQEAVVFLSDDLTHDSNAVHHFETLVVKHLKETRGLQLQHIVEFTDGCCSQYKSKSSFADISYSEVSHGITFERNYFGSRHGKGPSDGVSGVVKSAVRRAVISRKVTVNTAEEMFAFCNSNLTKDTCNGQLRSFFLVRRDDIMRNRMTNEVKSALAGTRILHAVKCISPGVIDTRILSCFCDGCMNGIEDPKCSNSNYVIPWQRRTLKMVHPVPEVTEPVNDKQFCAAKDPDVAARTGESEESIEELWMKLTNDGTPLDRDLAVVHSDPECEIDTNCNTGEDIDKLLAFLQEQPHDNMPVPRSGADLPVPGSGDDLPVNRSGDDLPVNRSVDDLPVNNQVQIPLEVTKDYGVFYSHPPKWYIGRVLEPPNNEGVRMKFLEQKGNSNLFSWPKTADEEIVDPVYIFHGPLTLMGHHPFSADEEDFTQLNEKYVALRKNSVHY